MSMVGGVGGCVGIGYEGSDFGQFRAIGADFAQKVQYLSCGGSSYNSRWHTPDAHLVIVMVNGGFVWSGGEIVNA